MIEQVEWGEGLMQEKQVRGEMRFKAVTFQPQSSKVLSLVFRSHSCGLGLISAFSNLLQIFQLPLVGDLVVIVVHLVQVHNDLHFAPSTRQGDQREKKYTAQSVVHFLVLVHFHASSIIDS